MVTLDTRPPTPSEPDLLDRRGDYGFDASTQGLVPIGAGATLAAGFAVYQARRGPAWLVGLEAVTGLALLATFGLYVHTTRRGKFAVWTEILPELHLRGDEHVLDLGCGRGAVLAMVAKLLPRGHATGVDLWTSDQSDNRPEATLRNVQLEGVADRCDVRTGDMLALPFEDATFDVVLSSMAIHNIDERDIRNHSRRFEALDEAIRVLKPGGQLVITDFWSGAYARHLRARGLQRVAERDLGWRFWYAPGLGAGLVTATRPLS